MAAIYNLSLNLKQLQNPKVMELVMQLERELEKTREPNPMEKIFQFLETPLLGSSAKELLLGMLADKLTQMQLVPGIGRELILIALEGLYAIAREALAPGLEKPCLMARQTSRPSSSAPTGIPDLMEFVRNLSNGCCQPAPFPATVNSPADIQVIRRPSPSQAVFDKDKQQTKEEGGKKVYPETETNSSPAPASASAPAPASAPPDLTPLLTHLNNVAVSSGVPPLNSGDLGMILGAMTGAPGGAATMQDLGQGLGALVGNLAGLLGQMGQPPRS